MLFTSPMFLFVFMPFAVVSYYLTPKIWRNGVLVSLSMGFYSWGEPKFVAIILSSALIDFAIGRRIWASETEDIKYRWLIVGVVHNILLLYVVKYIDFTLEPIRMLGLAVPSFAFPLPLAISFVVFEKITYLVDVRRAVTAPAKSLSEYLLFVFLFPKLLAGPIIKFHEVVADLGKRSQTFDNFVVGMNRFLLGLTKKVLIADVCGEIADEIFSYGIVDLGTRASWIGALAFTVQIYFDFSGYSDMAIGLARVFGFRLRENFNDPYTATSFTDFWHRWHMSLSTWIKEYLYIPLGGSHCGVARTYVNLWICFLLSGIWHGAQANFIIWGAYHGTFIVLHRIKNAWELAPTPSSISVPITFLLIVVGWVIFRAPDFAHLVTMVHSMFWVTPGRIPLLQTHQLLAMIVGLGATVIVPHLIANNALKGIAELPASRTMMTAGLMVASFVAILKSAAVTFNAFLYFRF